MIVTIDAKKVAERLAYQDVKCEFVGEDCEFRTEGELYNEFDSELKPEVLEYYIDMYEYYFKMLTNGHIDNLNTNNNEQKSQQIHQGSDETGR